MMCPAETRTPEPAASHVAAVGFWCRVLAVRPVQISFALVSPRPKSCRYHFAAEVLLTLI